MGGVAAGKAERAVWLAGIGPDLVSYAFDPRTGQLTRGAQLRLSAPVQYLWQHRDRHTLYVSSSNGGPDGNGGMARATRADLHVLDAVRLTSAGGLSLHGASVPLRQRPIHNTLDAASRHVLVSFRMEGEELAPLPTSRVPTLRNLDFLHPLQMASTLHVHPNGRFVYGANRVNSLDEAAAPQAGEDSIVACAFDAATGQLDRLQVIDTVGRHPRTFAIDPSGRWLVAGNKSPVVQQGGSVVPASLDVFAIGDDGRLTLAHSLALDMPPEASMFWSGFVSLPA